MMPITQRILCTLGFHTGKPTGKQILKPAIETGQPYSMWFPEFKCESCGKVYS